MEKSKKSLVLTEKPSVAADIAKALGGFEKLGEYYESKDFVITWAVGHILELFAPEDIDPKFKRWLIQDLPIIPERFSYKPKTGQEKRLEVIKTLSVRKDIDHFVNACDAGREGELIFREVYDYCQVSTRISRLWLQSMTANAIRTEFKKLRDGKEFAALADAARCRSESDWLIGMNVTRAMTRRLATRAKRGEAWSIGRVQTPTLALVVKREMEVLAHRAEPYWSLEATFSTPTHEYSASWFDPEFKKPQHSDDDENVGVREKDDRIFSKEALNSVLKELESQKSNTLATETRKDSKETAPQLFDLTLLQREANRRFGMSASRTLQAAQRLYEKHKLLTYPRTDARYLPEDYVDVCVDIIKGFAKASLPQSSVCAQIVKKGLLNQDRIFNNKEISDHFAIIPTGEWPSTPLEGDDARIFELVLKRFLAAFMPHAVWAKVERITRVGGQSFRTRVQDLQVPGWREVYGLDSEEESRLPSLDSANITPKANGQYPVEMLGAVQNESLTRPPSRLNEAKLLFLMEHCGKSLDDDNMAEALREKGIGTPATRAEVIENLVAKEYMGRVGRYLKPTVKGIRLVDIVGRIPVSLLASVELTGEMEYDLKLMEKGKKSRRDFMSSMINFTQEMVSKTKEFDYNALYEKDSALGLCQCCKSAQVVETFWSYRCTNKECEFNVWKEKNQRYIDRTVMADVLKGNLVGPLEFHSNGGNPFVAWLGTAGTGIMLFDEAGKAMETAPGAEIKVLGEYPLDQTFLGIPGKIIETETNYMCEFVTGDEAKNIAAAAVAAPGAPETPASDVSAAKTKGGKTKQKKPKAEKPAAKKKPPKKKIARMPKLLCGHPMSLDDFRSYVLTGSTPEILDFKSKKGRAFGASLHMKPDGSFEFKFVPRKKAVPAEGAEGVIEKPKKPRPTKVKIVKKTSEKISAAKTVTPKASASKVAAAKTGTSKSGDTKGKASKTTASTSRKKA